MEKRLYLFFYSTQDVVEGFVHNILNVNAFLLNFFAS